jgi:mannose-6-phosphate isomerase-like protein (cupin superfamily)
LGLTLGEAARLAEISDSHLSAIEIGRKVPSLPILAKVVAVLDLSLYEVLRDVARPMVRTGRLDTQTSGPAVISHEELVLRVATVIAPPGGHGDAPVPVGGCEVFVYVRQGELQVSVDGVTYDLGPGDTLDTDPATTMAYRTLGRRKSVSIWASAPSGEDERPRS